MPARAAFIEENFFLIRRRALANRGAANDIAAAPIAREEASLSWVAVAFFLGVAVVITFAGGVTRWLYPAAATLVAYLLYRRAPVTYVSFVWWIWFLSPFVRRVIDYRSGWVDPNPVLLAPPLVTLVCLSVLFRNKSVWSRPPGLIYLLAFGSVTYGLLAGLVSLPAKSVISSSLSWLGPLVFGFYLTSVFSDRTRAATFSYAIRRTFVWGLLAMGTYGILQMTMAPVWDQNWMIRSDMGSIGTPEPYQIRVFSTMNSPGPLGFMLGAGLLVIADLPGLLPLLARIAGFISLTLCLGRSAWIAWLAGAVYLGYRRKDQAIRFVVAIAILALCLGFLMTYEPVQATIQARLESLVGVTDDDSYQERRVGYQETLATLLADPLGRGLATMDFQLPARGRMGPHDSGFFELFLSLGWAGGAAYCAALALSLFFVLRKNSANVSLYYAGGGIVFGLIPQLVLGSVMIGVAGLILWSFIGIGLGQHCALASQSRLPERRWNL